MRGRRPGPSGSPSTAPWRDERCCHKRPHDPQTPGGAWRGQPATVGQLLLVLDNHQRVLHRSVARPGSYIREEPSSWGRERSYLDMSSDRPRARTRKGLVQIVDADECDCAHRVRLWSERTVDDDRTLAGETDGRRRIGRLEARGSDHLAGGPVGPPPRLDQRRAFLAAPGSSAASVSWSPPTMSRYSMLKFACFT